ncbi:MAG: hypothetical protein GF346_13175 [Candidatus Eisenbacteria bacterium]|nr:hypothetical protein [Candidatus Latescibacterota bacterium]MBD3303391.1 hypothetical protein [Candidatus Eisenbacteria bacterium]
MHGRRMALLIGLLIGMGSLPGELPGPAAAEELPFLLEGDLGLAIGVPQGDLADEIEDPGAGGQLVFGIGSRSMPIFVGANLGWMSYGSDSREERFSPDIPEVQVEVKTSNNILYGHLLLRMQPPSGRFRPYLDGLVGFKNFYTKTEIRNIDGNDEEPIAESKNLDDTALSYGIGGGLRYRIYTAETAGSTAEGDQDSTQKSPLRISLHAGAWYLLGGEADYLKEGSIRQEEGRVLYDISQSNTDLLIIHLGVSLSY